MRFDFSGYSLDIGRRELRRGPNLIDIEPQVFDLLVYLIENRDRVVTKGDLMAAVWGGRIVSESTLTSRITTARKAIGDTGERQHLIRTISRKGVRFVGAVAGAAEIDAPSEPSPEPRQEIRFCTTSDSVRIAYAVTGEGTALLKAANWLSHLELEMAGTLWSHWLDVLSRGRRLVRYDARGNGLSD